MTLRASVLEDQLQSMIHLTPSGPLEALKVHALLIKRFVEEFIFNAYAAWKLMLTNQAAKRSTEEQWWTILVIHYNLQFSL